MLCPPALRSRSHTVVKTMPVMKVRTRIPEAPASWLRVSGIHWLGPSSVDAVSIMQPRKTRKMGRAAVRNNSLPATAAATRSVRGKRRGNRTTP
ncbi:hypothetical protein [Wenjunlia tyrosinilytica]|nr:hypothetical protein [Wenjunlia tyrosinilytica]